MCWTVAARAAGPDFDAAAWLDAAAIAAGCRQPTAQALAQNLQAAAEAVLNVISEFLDDHQFDSKLDFAIRSWALQDKSVMKRVKRADDKRLAALTKMFERHGYDSADADVRARTMYLVQVGYISLQVKESLPTRMQRIPGYVSTFTGHMPSDQEIARFRARHASVGVGLPDSQRL